MTMRAWKISDDMPMTVGVEPRYTERDSKKYSKHYRKSQDRNHRYLEPPSTRWHMEVLNQCNGDPAAHWSSCTRFYGHYSLGDTYAVGMIVLLRKDPTAAWQLDTIAELGFSGSHKKRPLRFDSVLGHGGWVSLEDVRIIPTCLATDINDLSTGRLCMDIFLLVSLS